MTQRENCMQNSASSYERCPYCNRRRCGSVVNICNSIDVTQTANASGGNGGNGGSNGSSISSVSAASAAADRGGLAIASTQQSNEFESESEGLGKNQTSEEESLLQSGIGASASASNGATSNGSGGSGGSGGNGGSASNSVSAEINNLIILSLSGSDSASYSLGLDEKKLDIKIDETGSAYVNGKKMEESKLDNGTKVYIFSDNQEISKN